VNRLFYSQLDDDLNTERTIIEEEIAHNENLPDFSTRFGHNIEVITYNRPVKPQFFLKDTVIYNPDVDETENFRYLYSSGNTSKHGFTISIFHPLTETHNLVASILKIIVIVLIPLWLIMGLFNYMLSRKLWRPFYKTISQISHYNIKEKKTLSFPANNVYEFTRLNEVLSMMSEKIRNDYLSLKEFTEDASHEIQTPLAIIKSKLEMLVQSEHITQSELELIEAMNRAVTRISKLNSGLLLIAKIENNQFSETTEVSFIELLEQSLEIFTDFIQQRNLRVTFEKSSDFKAMMNPALADILVSNLINNSIKHNLPNGYIEIRTTSDYFSIVNSGNPLVSKNPSELFQRFNKENKQSESPGLGLAIIGKICDTSQLQINYQNVGDQHIIKISKK
jgi:signal transduction histidine kinase